MDIVNWDSLKKGLLLRNTLENPEDLVLVAANTTYKKRGDLYQTYAVPASSFVGGGGPIAIQENGNPVSAAATILNFVGATSVTGDPNVTVTIPTGPIIFKNTSVGTDVKNTTVPGITYSRLIPANTVTPGSIIRVSYRVKKDTVANTGPAYMAINIGTSYAVSSTVAFAEIDWSVLLPNAYGQIEREFVVDSVTSNTKFISNKSPVFDDDTRSLSEEFSFIDWTVNQNFYFTIQHLTSVSDSAAGSFYCIEIY